MQIDYGFANILNDVAMVNIIFCMVFALVWRFYLQKRYVLMWASVYAFGFINAMLNNNMHLWQNKDYYWVVVNLTSVVMLCDFFWIRIRNNIVNALPWVTIS